MVENVANAIPAPSVLLGNIGTRDPSNTPLDSVARSVQLGAEKPKLMGPDWNDFDDDEQEQNKQEEAGNGESAPAHEPNVTGVVCLCI